MASDAVNVHSSAEIINAATPADKSSERLLSDSNAWTIAIDLKLNLKEQTPEGHLGAERKSALLQSLKADSVGKPLSFVVQVSHPESDSSRSTQDAQSLSENVTRYVIHDGILTSLPSPQVKDPSELTADLVSTAGNLGAYKNLGLVIFSHGFGRHGIGGDAGKQSLDSLNSTIGTALSNLHKNKLDLLAFDGCSMAQVDTLEKMAPIAKDVVAAPEYMTCRDSKSCGINLNSWLGELVRKPRMTGVELGNAAVADVQREYRALGPGEASPTLANFALDNNYDQFKSALDNFSESLSSSLSFSKNRDVLRAITETVPEFERFYFLDPPYPPTKDLLTFAKEVNQETQNGKLFDFSNKLRDASQALINAQGKMIQSYFGARQNTAFDVVSASNLPDLNARARVTYEQLGGLSIAMPDNDQIALAVKQGGNYTQLVDTESLPELDKWRSFLHSVRD